MIYLFTFFLKEDSENDDEMIKNYYSNKNLWQASYKISEKQNFEAPVNIIEYLEEIKH